METQTKNFSKLPSVECGLFGLQEDYGASNGLSLDEVFEVNRPSVYLFKARGNSLKPLINEDDILIIDRALRPSSGDFVVGHFEGEFICKKIERMNGQLFLISTISKPIAIDNENFTLFGVVTGLNRRLR